MTLAILIFMGAATAVAVFLILATMRTTREEQRELDRAREREEAARLDAEAARATRARWEAKIAEDQLVAAATDPRGVVDGLGRDPVAPAPAGRFRRRDVPAPFSS